MNAENIEALKSCVFRIENDIDAVETYANSLYEWDKKYFVEPIRDAKETIAVIRSLIKKDDI